MDKDEIIRQLREEIKLLKARIEQLERRLARYENPHTPPSLRRGLGGGGQRPEEEETGEKKGPGRPVGHEGTTRPLPEPDRRVEVALDRCPHCDTRLGVPVRTESRVVEEIPEPPPVTVTEFRVHHYQCPGCGREVVASHPECPREGRFGRNVLTRATLLRYGDRLPLRKVCEALLRDHNLDVEAATVLDFTRRAARALRGEHEKILQKIRRAPVVHVDETCIHVSSRKYWIWVFTTPEETLLVVRNSRGRKVLREILGEEFQGVVVCDGWRSYLGFARLQRCWAHLLRELKDLAGKVAEAGVLHRAMSRFYRQMKEAVSRNPTPRERDHLYRNGLARLRWWTRRKFSEPAIRRMQTKIRNGLPHWLTFLRVPGVEPTNNRAERGLRESVVLRKIIGTLRNTKGTQIFETIMTLLMTWRQQGLNPTVMMRRSLG